MKNKYAPRVLMTQEEYRKSERNKRLLRKAIIVIAAAPFITSAVAAVYMTWFR